MPGYGGDLTRSNFVTGAVNRDFSTCGSFSDIGGSLARKLRFGIWMLSLEAFLRRSAFTELPHVNLEVPISWQAQDFVFLYDLEDERRRLEKSSGRAPNDPLFDEWCSGDYSAATDGFPTELNRAVLEEYLRDSYAPEGMEALCLVGFE